MPERERKQKPAPKEREQETEEVDAPAKQGDVLIEEFVRNYVQKDGQ